MITWGEVHMEWEGVDVIKSLTHTPTGIVLEVNEQDTGQRNQLLEMLNDKVEEGTNNE